METEHVYSWKALTQIRIDPQKAGERIELIREKNGGDVTPRNVLDDAKFDNSPLHKHFEWDDAKAAESHRLDQAGHLIRSLVVEVKFKEAEPPKKVRAFVSITKETKPRYTSMATAMSDKEMRRQILDRAWAELIGWRERYADLKELARLFSLIDRESERRKVA